MSLFNNTSASWETDGQYDQDDLLVIGIDFGTT